MDKKQAIDTIVGLKVVYDGYSRAFQIALDIINEKVIITDSEKAVVQSDLDSAKDTITELTSQINDKEGMIADLQRLNMELQREANVNVKPNT